MNYFVRLIFDSSVKLSTYSDLQRQPHSHHYFGDGKQIKEVRLFERRTELGGIFVFDGFFADVLVDSENFDSAIAKATSHVSLLTSLIVLSTPAAVGGPSLWIAYEADPDSASRTVIFEADVPGVNSPMTLKRNNLATIYENVREFQQHCSPQEDERLQRALRLLKRGLSETDILGEFQMYWTALETVDPVLQQPEAVYAQCSKCKSVTFKCAKCGHRRKRLVISPNRLAGIERLLLTDLGRDLRIFRRLRALRARIVHHGEGLKLNEFREVAEHIKLVRQWLTAALLKVIGVAATSEMARTILNEIPRRERHCRMRAIVKIKDFPFPGLSNPSLHPQIEWEFEEGSLAVAEEDQDALVLKDAVTIKAINFTFADQPRQIVIEYPRDVGVSDVKINP